jgi:glycine/D-amino acid oxidase-like deaminating enzyme
MISRRSFLLGGAGTLTGCERLPWREVMPEVTRPGMHIGHALRDGRIDVALAPPSGHINTTVLILGSGVAALTAAWKLAKEGFTNFLVLNGPEFGGNAASGSFGELRYPCGAHYLPLPSQESAHVREMLADLGVILRNPHSERPGFDERCIVHSPDERLFFRGSWQEGLIPSQGLAPDEQAQHKRFHAHIERLKQARGPDGRKLFAVPVVFSSQDPETMTLDTMSFRTWLEKNDYTAPTLHWYLNYICRDEYGAEYGTISAWAGLHYFASRAGRAENAEDGALLTWPDGLQALVRGLDAQIRKAQPQAFLQGAAVKVTESGNGVDVLCALDEGVTATLRTFLVRANQVVCAMPLYAAARVADLKRYGFDVRDHLPPYAPWTVSNFLLKGFPQEENGTPLSWDNVVYGGHGLGYVVSTHQDIRVAIPPKTVFSAYHALSARSPREAREWLLKAGPEALYDEVASDLKQVYGWHLRRHVEAMRITVRGHGMASPMPGFLSNRGLRALREADGKILFAHSDLSGYSVFEEAAWWGYRAAGIVLGRSG